MPESPTYDISTSLSFDDQEGPNHKFNVDEMAPSIFGSPIPKLNRGHKRKSSNFSIFGDKKPSTPASKRLSIRRAACLLSLPVELQIKIFEFLDPNSSACLGLTCKELYDIHWEEQGIVPLTGYHNGLWLHELLASWASPLVARAVRTNRILEIMFQERDPNESFGREFWRAWLGREGKSRRELGNGEGHSGIGGYAMAVQALLGFWV
jgi:hypothetical protein